jgi:hypothetical protein
MENHSSLVRVFGKSDCDGMNDKVCDFTTMIGASKYTLQSVFSLCF